MLSDMSSGDESSRFELAETAVVEAGWLILLCFLDGATFVEKYRCIFQTGVMPFYQSN